MRVALTHQAIIAATLALSASSLDAQIWNRDEVRAERSARLATSGATAVRVEAHAGSLRIEGRDGLTEVRAHGTARASSRGILEDVLLTVERRGSAIVVLVDTPEDLDDGDHAALDLVVELPKTLDVRVNDGSGDAEVRGVKSLDIEDGSGEVRVFDIGGPVRVDDGSGDVRIENARGDVHIDDGSGGIDLRTIRGSVTVDDGSGNFDAHDVTGTVRVVSKGSGSIDVAVIGGDFIVQNRSSGSIDHRDVKGTVDVPTRRGRRW
jgi:hypothetical protein